MDVTGAGGSVFYDPNPTIRYRQHGKNLIGANVGMHTCINRLSMIFKGCFKIWTDLNVLLSISHLLIDKNKQVLITLISALNQRLISRLILLKRTGIYRQTFLGNIALIVAVFFNKI